MRIGILSFAHLHAEGYVQNLRRISGVEVIRSRILLRSSSLSFPELIWRAMLPLIVARPASICSELISLSRTSYPARAQTWAMPLPICPAPMTPTILIAPVT
jgi:hypothetical protein